MKTCYVIQNIDGQSYYDGSNIDEDIITESNFTDNIFEAIMFDDKLEAMSYVHNMRMMYVTIIEIIDTD